MAFLKEDQSFTHVIAIDFGTGASGYSSLSLNPCIIATAWRLNSWNRARNRG